MQSVNLKEAINPSKQKIFLIALIIDNHPEC